MLGLLLSDFLVLADSTTAVLLLGDSATWSSEDAVEVHTENTSGGIVLNSEIDMLVNTESEVAYKMLDFSSLIIIYYCEQLISRNTPD